MTPWERFRNDFQGRKVLIMGLGLQGRGAGDARIFSEAGAKVTVTDLKDEKQLRSSIEKLKSYDIKYILGEHREVDFMNTDMVIRNPDVTASPFLDVAEKAGIPVKMDSSLFVKYCDCPIIGITGTRGKTTTTMMIYQMLKEHLKFKIQKEKFKIAEPAAVYLGGNVPGKATLELLRKIQKSTKKYKKVQKSLVVLELSSWELKGWHDERISPHIAVFTNFYEDHLNRYRSMKEYFKDKTAIFKYQNENDFLILNRKFEGNQEFEGSGKKIYFSAEDLAADFKLKIPGEHNRENAAAALAAGKILGIPETEILNLLRKFNGVACRLEKVGVIGKVDFINDTTSTTPAAGAAALRAMDQPVVLIAGGSSKKLNPQPLAAEIVKGLKNDKIKKIIWLKGEGTSELLSNIASLDPSVRGPARRQAWLSQENARVFDNFEKAVITAYKSAGPGEAVLLSPGCASFSMFQNEFERGDRFNAIVTEMAAKSTDQNR